MADRLESRAPRPIDKVDSGRKRSRQLGYNNSHQHSDIVCSSLNISIYPTISIAKMEAQILSPEMIQDTLRETVTFVPADKIDETFKSDSIGER